MNEKEEQLLRLMEPGAELTKEQLNSVETDDDLREAATDLFVLQGMMAEEPDTEAALQRFHTKLARKARTVGLWWKAVAVAACMAGIVVVAHQLHRSDSHSTVAAVETSAPAKMPTGITLTKEDGKPVALNIKKKKNAPDVELTVAQPEALPTTEVETQHLSVPYGESLKLTLPDGTEVYMHPGSSLTYPNCFTGREREVTLNGEAYFCVAHLKEKPFVVHTSVGDVRDYGTEFNIDAYADRIDVVLVEGSAGVKTLHGKELKMQPGQRLTVIKEGWTLNDADTDYYLAWRDGYFYFDQEKLGDILTQLSLSYGLPIECHSPELLNLRLRYIIPRKSNARYAVEILNRLQKGHIHLVDDRIVVR